MSEFVVVAGKAGALYFDGKDAFTKDPTKAKAYASEAAGKRAMNKAQSTTGRNGLRIVSTAPPAPEKPERKAARKK